MEAYHNVTIAVEESTGVLGGEDKKGLGGICKEWRLPSNISTTLLIGGRFDGLYAPQAYYYHLPCTFLISFIYRALQP
jgi:hypothetical protein